jgi:uncharacterized protein YcbK (DUF882 family)
VSRAFGARLPAMSTSALRRTAPAALAVALALSTPLVVAAPGPGAPAPAAAPAPAVAPAAKPAPGKPAPKLSAKAAKAARARNAPVVLYSVNHHDTMSIRVRDAQGKAVPWRPQQKRFDRFLRCHYTNKQHAMNPRLLRLLYQTGHHWPGKRLEVVSGYREPSVAKNPHSPHMKGLACDFRVTGVKNTELRDYLRQNMKKVGVGYYPNSSFVHLDVRKDRSAFWIDYSGPGERSVYSQNAALDLKSGRAEQYHPTKIGDDFLDDAAGEGTAKAGEGTPAPAPVNTAGGVAVQGPALAGQPAPRASATP